MPKEVLHIYLRVSSSTQEEDGYGLETQRKVGLDIAQNNNLTPVMHVEGAASSSQETLSNRPVMSSLLSKIEQGVVQNLYVYQPDRLSRNDQTSSLIRYQLFKNNVRLYTQGGLTDFSNPQDNLMFGILSQFASYENEIRTGRLRRGRLETVRAGNWHGGTVTFGYKIEDHKLVIDDETADWVRKIYKWYADGLTIDQIRIALVANGVLTGRGKSNWGYNTLRILLSNKTYDGYRTYTDKVVGDTVSVECPRIIDPLLSKQVRDKLADVRLNAKPNNQKYVLLLKDLMVCGNCGSKIGQRIKPNQHTRHYVCKHNEQKHRLLGGRAFECVASDGSRIRGANVDEADHLVWISVVKTLSESSLYKEDFKHRKLGIETTSIKDESTLKKRVRSLDKEIKKYQTVLTQQKVLKEIGQGADVVHTIQNMILEKEAEKGGVLSDISRLKLDKKWIDWVGDFNLHIDDLVNGKWSVEDKTIFLRGVIDEIKMTTVNTQEHRFDIKFSVAHDGSRIVYHKGSKSKYDVVEGADTVTVNTVDGLRGLQKKR